MFVYIAAKKIVAEVAVGAEPEGMATSPDGRWVICTSETASLVHFIDARERVLVDSVMVGTRPRDAVFSRDGRWLWVSSEMRATVAVFDMTTRRVVRTIDFDRADEAPMGVQAVGLALTPDYRRAFVALGRGNQVAEVEPQSGRILRYFPVGQRTWSIALSKDGRRLYAAAGLSGDVTVIDLNATARSRRSAPAENHGAWRSRNEIARIDSAVASRLRERRSPGTPRLRGSEQPALLESQR